MQKAWTHSRTNANCGEVQRCIFFTCKKAFETQISLHKTGWPHHFIFAYSHIMYGKWHIRPPRLDGCKFLPFLSHPSCCLPRNQSVNSLTVRYANNHPIWPFGLVKTDLSHHYDTQLNKKKAVSSKRMNPSTIKIKSDHEALSQTWFQAQNLFKSFGGWPVLVVIL